MSNLNTKELLEAGVHFGHLTRKWNPKMAPFILMEENGIHLIDLNKTIAKLEDAKAAVKNIVKTGKKVLFVATKKQAKELVAEEAKNVNMPFVTERWLGGMLTNFATVRKSIKKMQNFEKMSQDGTYQNISKRERLMIEREKLKLEKLLGGIEDMVRLPAALFIVDSKREHIAVAEAQRLNIPIFAIVDTNSDPSKVDYPIPANDDASKSIYLITHEITEAIVEGLKERKEKIDKEEEEIVENAKIVKEAELEENI